MMDGAGENFGAAQYPGRYSNFTLEDKLHWSTKFNFFFGTRGKISNPIRTFNAEFKRVSSFSPSPTVCL